jgi:hypothetical protein
MCQNPPDCPLDNFGFFSPAATLQECRIGIFSAIQSDEIDVINLFADCHKPHSKIRCGYSASQGCANRLSLLLEEYNKNLKFIKQKSNMYIFSYLSRFAERSTGTGKCHGKPSIAKIIHDF